ncbi:hypothetical protein [Ligilactobacillus saerimneri]|uniref:ABC transporter permease n=1 Tax=Ligilactobacillus saerimneri 30a TaxID=1227363 RepID=M5J5Y2_9LACO|nr:hypothetical protein [Ligilactobacillus saerimneri]EKW98845.1 ABC transporter permease [Ligilactobacillus saerimneri 30a]
MLDVRTRKVAQILTKRYLRNYVIMLVTLLGLSLVANIFKTNGTFYETYAFLPIGGMTVIMGFFVLYTYPDFKYLIQNGVSRRTYWKGKVWAIVIAGALTRLLSYLLYFATQVPFQALSNRITYLHQLKTDISDSIFFELFGHASSLSGTHLGWTIAGMIIYGVVLTLEAWLWAMAIGALFSLLTRKAQVVVGIALVVGGNYLMFVILTWMTRHQEQMMINLLKYLDQSVLTSLPYSLLLDGVTAVIALLVSYWTFHHLYLRND